MGKFVLLVLALLFSQVLAGTLQCNCGYGGFCAYRNGNFYTIVCRAYSCSDLFGTFYNDCNTIRNYCSSSPCVRGQCVPTFGGFFCDCPKGHFGQLCDFSDPDLESEGVKNALYVYYQVQTRTDGQKVPFYLMYDPGLQTGIRKFNETGVKINITSNDGRVYYPMRKYQFTLMNVKEKCLEDSLSNSEVYDSRVCDLLPEGEHYTFKLNTLFDTKVHPSSLRYFKTLKNPVGAVSILTITVSWMKNGKLKRILYQRNYVLFTYYIGRVRSRCYLQLKYDGCSTDKAHPVIFLRGRSLTVISITKNKNSAGCGGLRTVGSEWSVQRDVGHNGEYDPIPKVVNFGDTDDISFPPLFFTDGVHLIQQRLTLMGNPPRHGGQKKYDITAVCWIKISLGPMNVQANGGNELTASCYNQLQIGLISLNPGLPLSEMSFKISCKILHRKTRETDSECKEKETEVPIIRKQKTQCNTLYEYTVIVTHFISTIMTQKLIVVVHFVPSQVRLTIECQFNCFPIDTAYRMVMIAKTTPYIPATIEWKLSIDGHLVPEYLYQQSTLVFAPLQCTRVLRADGFLFSSPERSIRHVKVEASIQYPPLRAALTTVSSGIQHAIVLGQANYFEPNSVNYTFPKFDFEYPPVTFTISQLYPELNDHLNVLQTNYVEKLTTVLHWNVVQLCGIDAMEVLACGPSKTFPEIKQYKPTITEVLNQFKSGNVETFLYYTALWLRSGFLIIPVPGNPETQEVLRIFVWNYDGHSPQNRAYIVSLLLKLDLVREDHIQTIFYILSLLFFSHAGNVVENFPLFNEPFEMFPIPVTEKDYYDWMSARVGAIQVTLAQCKRLRALGAIRPHIKLTNYLYGDLLDGLLRVWNLAYIHGVTIRAMTTKLIFTVHIELLEAQQEMFIRYNDKLLWQIAHELVDALSNFTRLFYGTRDIGTFNTRIWAVRSTYQGILTALNKSNPRREYLAGYSSFIFGPVDPHLEPWLKLASLRLPHRDKVDTLLGRELVFIVFLTNNRPGDDQISPTLYVTLMDKYGNPFSTLPGRLDYTVTLPVVIDGRFDIWGNTLQIVYEDIVINPKNSLDKLKYFNVYKIMLPNEFEVWELRLMTQAKVPLKVLIDFNTVPEYDAVDNAPIVYGNYSDVLLVYTVLYPVKPQPPDTALPLYFYVGILLSSEVPADIPVRIYIRNAVFVCWLQDPHFLKDEHTCKGVEQGDSRMISCICNEFGFIKARFQNVRVTKLIMTLIDLTVVKSITLVLKIFPIILFLAVITALVLAFLADRRRKNQTVLILAEDTRPGDTCPLIIGVYTSANVMAGTRSTVALKVIGLNSSSRVHLLKCKSRKTLKTACDDWFVVTTNQPLGKISSVILWHDFHLLSNWYCSHIMFYDIKQELWYIAYVHRWFRLHPSKDDSRFAIVKAYKFGNLEKGLRAMPNKFRNHLIMQTRNAHYLLSMFTLSIRCLYNYEFRTCAFLIKFLTQLVFSWYSHHVHLFHDELKLGDAPIEDIHFDEDTLYTIFLINALSYMVLMPYILLIRSAFVSGLLQKKTTNPINVEIIRMEQSRIGASKDDKKGEAGQASEKQQRSVVFQLDSEDRSTSTQSWITKTREVAEQPKAKKQWTATHLQHSRFRRFMTLAFGPVQFRCINVAAEGFEMKTQEKVLYSRLLASFLILACLIIMTWVDVMTDFQPKLKIILFVLLLTMVFDFFILNPLIIIFNSYLCFFYLQTSSRDLHLWSEGPKLSLPTPKTFEEYSKIATQKPYKPVLTTDIEKISRKSTIYSAFRIGLLYVYIILVIYSISTFLFARYDMGYYHSVRTLRAAAASRGIQASEYSRHARSAQGLVTIDEVVTPSQAMEGTPTVFGDLAFRWPNGKHMTPQQDRFFLDRVSKPFGPASILVTTLNRNKPMRIPRHFKPYFVSALGYLEESEISTEGFVIAKSEFNFTTMNQHYLLQGKSGSKYGLIGNNLVIPMENWKSYYIQLATVLDEMHENVNLAVRRVVLSFNVLTANTHRLLMVDFVIEFMPSGECSTNLLVDSTVSPSQDRVGPLVTWRIALAASLIILYAVVIVDVSTLGLRNYLAHWYGKMKILLCIVAVIVMYTTTAHFLPKYSTLDRLYKFPSDKFTDVHSLIRSELRDSIGLAALLLLLCADIVVSIRDALGLKMLTYVTTVGLRMSVSLLLVIVIYSEAGSVSANMWPNNRHAFMTHFFSKCIFPISSKDEIYEVYLVGAIVIVSVFWKFSLANFVFHFEMYDGSYVSDYHPGRSAEVLSRLKPLRDTLEVKTRYLKKHSTYIERKKDSQVDRRLSIRKSQLDKKFSAIQ